MYRTEASEAEVAAMARAIELAKPHRPHPNPRVGSVVLDAGGRVVGEGAHIEPGTPHAERHALATAGERARGGTVVVTLEPCSFRGRTEPCVDALIEAGVARVVAAVEDPDRRVSGSAFAKLTAAGIDVVVGPLADQAEALDAGYFVHRRLGRPRVVAVVVGTLDGQVADSSGRTAAELAGPEALDDIARQRGTVDALLTGSGYVDQLRPPPASVVGPPPRLVVVSGRRRPQVDMSVFPTPPIVFAALEGEAGVPARVVAEDGKVDLAEALRRLGDEGHLDVQVEGGRPLTTALARAGLVDEYLFYVVGRIAGGTGRSPFDGTLTRMGDARRVAITDVRRLANDVRLHVQVEET